LSAAETVGIQDREARRPYVTAASPAGHGDVKEGSMMAKKAKPRGRGAGVLSLSHGPK